MKKSLLIIKIFVTLSLLLCIACLEHDKSFLVPDATSNIDSMALHKSYLLITNSNDIIQKDIETGVLQRTFRAHQNTIVSFVVTEDFRMITSAYDDLIIVWNLDTGSIIRRISARASYIQIVTISYFNEKVVFGGWDYKIRQADLISGRILKTIDIEGRLQQVIADGDFVYVASDSPPYARKISLQDDQVVMLYTGHNNTVFSMYLNEDILYSGSADTSILCWDKDSGLLVRSFIAHKDWVTKVAVYNGELYSASREAVIIKWDISNSQVIKTFSIVHTLPITSFAFLPERLFTGSIDTIVVKWDTVSGEAIYEYKGLSKKMRAVAAWKNMIIGGGDDVSIKVWDQSVDSYDTSFKISTGSNGINCLQIYENFLYSGGQDNFVRQWNLTNFSLTRNYESSNPGFLTVTLDQSFVYAGGQGAIIYIWNISSAILQTSYTAHTATVNGLIIDAEVLYSGSYDRSVRVWDLNSGETVQVLDAIYPVNDILLMGDTIIACTDVGLEAFSTISGQKETVSDESLACSCMISNNDYVFTGQGDSTIKVRDMFTLSVLETYQGHLDFVNNLCFDEASVLYSAASDGSIKKWNMALRRVAFSFEIRNDSVSALAAHGNQLLVGLRKGSFVNYNIESSYASRKLDVHTNMISSILSDGDFVYSSGLEGLITKFSFNSDNMVSIIYSSGGKSLKSLVFSKLFFIAVEDENNIIFVSSEEQSKKEKSINFLMPLTCVAATEIDVMAGSRSGVIYAWNMETLAPSFELKGHISPVNFLLVVKTSLFSASDDKTTVEWSLESKVLRKVYKRTSAAALGHLGPVNSLSYCYGTLFSVGADRSVRRWNVQTGRHEDVYFGFSKSITSVLCHNRSVFAGSDDFAVLMFKPELPQQDSYLASTTKPRVNTVTQRQRVVVMSIPFESSRIFNGQAVGFAIGVPLTLLAVCIFVFIFYRRTISRKQLTPDNFESKTELTQTVTDLETVINTVIGISKHAAYLIESSFVAKTKKLTAGGGGELFLATLMESNLRKKHGEIVVQKIVSAQNSFMEEAFYQEVGIMIMLSTFPNFCKIIGYTEKPLSMVLKYYPDGSLMGWLRTNRIKKCFITKLSTEISKALGTMHSQFLAHCDIKTQNVLVEVNAGVPTCFLTDFGITQILSEKIIATKSFRVINLRGLSVQYAAPEAFTNFRSKNYNGVDFKHYDIFSLACVYYELLTQMGPWDLN